MPGKRQSIRGKPTPLHGVHVYTLGTALLAICLLCLSPLTLAALFCLAPQLLSCFSKYIPVLSFLHVG
jgi:hypothetical protein